MASPLIAAKDEAVAIAFWASCTDVDKLLDRFPEATEREFLDDAVKMGCYLKYRSDGMEHPLAAMQACRRGPQMKNSDRTFNQGQRRKMNGIEDGIMRQLLKYAGQAGIKTQGKFYVGGLARRGLGPRDPQAWVSTTDDILEVARKRNLEVEGVVNHKSSEPPPPKRIPLAADIVQSLCQAELKRDPELAAKVGRSPKQMAELRERIVAKHSRKNRSL